MKSSQKLSSTDWIKAGFRALTAEGTDGLKVERLARAMGTTKGSFYWHFNNASDFKTRMLGHWLDEAFTAVTYQVECEQGAIAQLQRLMELAAQTPDEYGGKEAESAIRAWARSDIEVAEAVSKIDLMRISFLKKLLANAKLDEHTALSEVSTLDAQPTAELIYAAYVGYLSLPDLDDDATKNGLMLLLRHLNIMS